MSCSLLMISPYKPFDFCFIGIRDRLSQAQPRWPSQGSFRRSEAHPPCSAQCPVQVSPLWLCRRRTRSRSNWQPGTPSV